MRELSSGALLGNRLSPRLRPDPVSRLTVYFMIFAVSISAFVFEHISGDRFPSLAVVLHIIGLVPCGLAWLFARSLFRQRASGEYWPELIVGMLFASCVILYIDSSNNTSGLLGYIAQLQAFIGSAILLMTFIEALDSKMNTKHEQRFRFLFAAGHLALISTSFAFELPELSVYAQTAYATLATFALLGSTAAWQYRRNNPLPGSKQKNAVVQPALAASIEQLLRDDRVYLDPTIKVSGLAARLDQPDYKVSQCIVNDLGYPNFNQLVNTYRLEEAKLQLADPERKRSAILAIAMDCGFGSLGPFNRAFKAQVGMTPTAYRKSLVSEAV